MCCFFLLFLKEVEHFNKEAEKIKKEGEAHLKRKIRSRRTEKEMTRLVSGCDKLWKKKSTEARQKADSVDEEEEDKLSVDDESCREEKPEEICKYRNHQYRENPRWR